MHKLFCWIYIYICNGYECGDGSYLSVYIYIYVYIEYIYCIYSIIRITNSLFTCVYIHVVLKTREFILNLWSFWWNKYDQSWIFFALSTHEKVWRISREWKNMNRKFSGSFPVYRSGPFKNGENHAIPWATPIFRQYLLGLRSSELVHKQYSS